MKGNIINSATYCIVFIVASFFLTSCLPSSAPSDNALDYQSPFGLNWQTVENIEPRSGFGSLPEHSSFLCGNPATRIEKFFGTSLTNDYRQYCESLHFVEDFIAPTGVAERFRDGSVSVSRNADEKPFVYEYSFGHELAPAPKLKDARKKKHKALYAELKQIYGAPKAKGNIFESEFIEFSDNLTLYRPCSVWVEQSIVIILCRERVKYLDGVETALIYINLSAHPDAGQFASAIGIDWEPEADRSDSVFENNEEHIRTLLNWTGSLYGNDFPACEKDTNLPLLERAKISVDTQKLLQPLLDNYSGESLMEHIYENVSEIEEMVPDANIDNVIMYLIFTAADDGVAGAYNEIGGSLLHCYQDVQQDFIAAREWFEKAAAKDDPMSMQSIALLTILEPNDPQISRQRAIDWLERCTELDPDLCSAELAALRWVESLHSQ